MVFAGFEDTGGGVLRVVVFFIVSGDVIVVVFVNVGWFASSVLPETVQWGTGSGFGVVIVFGGLIKGGVVSWFTKGGSPEAGWLVSGEVLARG